MTLGMMYGGGLVGAVVLVLVGLDQQDAGVMVLSAAVLLGVCALVWQAWELAHPQVVAVRGGGKGGGSAPAVLVRDSDAMEEIKINGHVRRVAPPETVAPAAGGVGLVEAMGAPGAAQWYQDQAGIAPWDAPAASPEPAKGQGDAPLLPRRSPTLLDYKLIIEVLERTRSQNQAIAILWGSKDGKTLAWASRVRGLCLSKENIERADIIAWELATGDDVVDVAERLGVGVDEVQAVFDER